MQYTLRIQIAFLKENIYVKNIFSTSYHLLCTSCACIALTMLEYVNINMPPFFFHLPHFFVTKIQLLTFKKKAKDDFESTLKFYLESCSQSEPKMKLIKESRSTGLFSKLLFQKSWTHFFSLSKNLNFFVQSKTVLK